jgi:hypothetical protein
MHALRSTLGTMLARSGVTPQVGRQIMRHSDYRTTLQHYTRLELVDAQGAISKMASVAAPAISGAPAADSNPQQIPQQSGHDDAPHAATPCVEGEKEASTSGRRKGLRGRFLREPARADATRSDEGELELAMAEPGLGNDCSGVGSIDGQEITTADHRPPADSPAATQRGAAAACETMRSKPGDDALEHVAQAWGTLPLR